MKTWHFAVGLSAVTLLAFNVGLAPTPAPAPTPFAGMADEYQIDTTHSKALFRVLHNGVAPFYGRFNDVSGTISFDGSSADSLSLNVTVKVESVDTGNDKLDGHLKSPDFFNARENPTLTFKSSSVKPAGDGSFAVTGELTIHGVTKTVTVEVENTGMAESGRGKRCGFETIFEIKRSDYGMSYGLDRGMLGDDIRVIVGLEAAQG